MHVYVHFYIEYLMSCLLQQNRRRSQRNVGQRKRYVDDLTISISDDELMEEVMSSRPRAKKEYKVCVRVGGCDCVGVCVAVCVGGGGWM